MAVYMRRQAIVDPTAVRELCKKEVLRKRQRGGRLLLKTTKSRPRTVDKVRFVVMGAAKVGKTSLIKRFLFDTFDLSYKETVEDMFQGYCDAHNVRWILEILDTAGAHSFPPMRKLAIDAGRVFFLVYSVVDEESFEEVRRLREQILAQRADEPAPIVVIGNKCDVAIKHRFLPLHTLDFIVNIEWGHYYFETSAMTNVNVDMAFKEVLFELVQKGESNSEAPICVVEEKPADEEEFEVSNHHGFCCGLNYNQGKSLPPKPQV